MKERREELEKSKRLLEVIKKHQGNGNMWQDIADIMNKEYGENLSAEGWRTRYKRLDTSTKTMFQDKVKQEDIGNEEIKEQKFFEDGSVEILKNIVFADKEPKTPEVILYKLGYSPSLWEIVEFRFGTWETFVKDNGLQMQTTVRIRLRPKKFAVDIKTVIEETKQALKENIQPLKLDKVKVNKELNDDLLIEQPAVELHLGKLACEMDCGENYDQKIAQERFRNIVQKTVEEQQYRKCGTLLLGIGNDFFNSDNNNDTTNKGTQMHSDVRWRKMFLTGLKLYIEAIKTYRENFNRIDIQLISGNHDLTTSFYLFTALEQAFANDNKVNFIENYKEVQCYVFGKCMIASTHGNINVNRTLDSIPAEFPIEYGQTLFRELHLAHLHSEQDLKERLGIIPKRVSAATGKDAWEYDERFNQTIQKQTLFIWDAKQGNMGSINIPFQPIREKNKVKELKK